MFYFIATYSLFAHSGLVRGGRLYLNEIVLTSGVTDGGGGGGGGQGANVRAKRMRMPPWHLRYGLFAQVFFKRYLHLHCQDC